MEIKCFQTTSAAQKFSRNIPTSQVLSSNAAMHDEWALYYTQLRANSMWERKLSKLLRPGKEIAQEGFDLRWVALPRGQEQKTFP
jgi:hypothetical protein